MNLVPTRLFLTSMATISRQAAAGVAGPLHSAYLGLFTAPTPNPSVNMLLSDVTEASYTSYARQALVFGANYVDQQGQTAFDAGSLEFQPSDAVNPNTITGIMVCTAVSAGALLLAGKLDTPVALPDALHLLDVLTQYLLDPDAAWGDFVVVC